MKIKIKHYHKNKTEVLKTIEHLNKMSYPLRLNRLNHVFIGYVDNIPVCFLGLNQRNGWYYFRGCYVEPSFRGNGFQVKMMETAFEKAKQLGINRISSLVDINNNYSLHNALEAGFQITGRKKNNYHIVKYLSEQN